MGIQQVNIKGFRSLRDVTWEPGRLNVIIGPNGSGKSNLMRALALLQKAAQGDLPKEILGMGGISPLLWDGQVNEISWSVRTDPMDPDHDPARESLTYDLCLRQLGGGSAYRVNEEQLTIRTALESGPKAQRILERRPDHALLFDFQERQLSVVEGSVADEQVLLALAGGPFGSPMLSGFRSRMAGWALYHDIHVDPGAALRQAAVARMDRRVAPDGQNLIPVLHTLYTGSRDFKRILDDAMRAAFSADYEELVFAPAADQRVQLRVRWRSLKTEQSAADLSDGTIRFLLLIAILANPTPPDVLAIDEPEIGLHPSMLPIIAEHAVDAATRTQVILTTHSTQLLDAFTETPPTTTVTRWEDGETKLSVIDGEALKRWLAEYTLGALYRSGELEGMA